MGHFDYKWQFVVPCYLDTTTGQIVPMTDPSGVGSESGATVQTSSSGDTTIVSAVASRSIRVTAIALISNGTVNVKWKSGATDITGLAYLVANTGYAPGYNPRGHFQTAAGEALVLNLSGAIAVGGWIKYALV